MNENIRWKQRFENFEKALSQLRNATELESYSDLEKEGIIQRFEFTHELAWKVLKDFFEDQGETQIFGSKDATRLAFNRGLISDGENWMKMIQVRNKTVHAYSIEILENEFKMIINDFYPLLNDLKSKLKKLL